MGETGCAKNLRTRGVVIGAEESVARLVASCVGFGAQGVARRQQRHGGHGDRWVEQIVPAKRHWHTCNGGKLIHSGFETCFAQHRPVVGGG